LINFTEILYLYFVHLRNLDDFRCVKYVIIIIIIIIIIPTILNDYSLCSVSEFCRDGWYIFILFIIAQYYQNIVNWCTATQWYALMFINTVRGLWECSLCAFFKYIKMIFWDYLFRPFLMNGLHQLHDRCAIPLLS
jgi:hypothetical protein